MNISTALITLTNSGIEDSVFPENDPHVALLSVPEFAKEQNAFIFKDPDSRPYRSKTLPCIVRNLLPSFAASISRKNGVFSHIFLRIPSLATLYKLCNAEYPTQNALYTSKTGFFNEVTSSAGVTNLSLFNPL